MDITVDTKLIGLLGNPLRQSFSPHMQNQAYRAAGLNYCYLPIETSKEHLGAVLEGLRHLNFAGFGVTKPFKVEILKYLDDSDELVKQVGSCNTVVNLNGVYKGYNTDGDGCVLSLVEEGGINIPSCSFFSYGAGGAAKAVCFALAFRGASKFYISSIDGAEELARNLNYRFGNIAQAVPMQDSAKMRAAVEDSHVILNLSGVGMFPHCDETIFPKEYLSRHQICYDATYNPDKTRFLLEAGEAGCKTINGLGMVINQGALQFRLWTGLPEPFACMRSSIQALLAEQKSRAAG